MSGCIGVQTVPQATQTRDTFKALTLDALLACRVHRHSDRRHLPRCDASLIWPITGYDTPP